MSGPTPEEIAAARAASSGGPTPEEIAAARAASSGGPTPEEIAAARKRSDEKLEAMMGSRASNLDRRHIEVGPWEAALLGSATGAPVAGGLVDELSGATYAALAKAKGLDRSGVQFSGSEPEQGVGVGELYRQGRDYARDLQSSAREQHPYAFGIPNVVAGMVSPVPKSLAVTKDASTAARYANAAKLGILEGIGRGTSDLTKGDVTGVLRDAAVGGVTAPAVVAAGDVVGGAAKYANRKLTDTRRLLQEWGMAARKRQQKLLSNADILPDEEGRDTVLDAMMTWRSPKDPNERMTPWVSSPSDFVERALPSKTKGPGIAETAGAAKGALVDELDRGRVMTPGFSYEGIPQKLEAQAAKFEAAPSTENRALARAYRDEASTFYDEKATQAAQEAENRAVADAARKARAEFEAFNAAARAKRGDTVKAALGEFEAATGAKKAAETDLESYLAAARAAKADAIAKAKAGIGTAEAAAERARLSKMVPPVYKAALSGPQLDPEGSRIMEILKAPAPKVSRDSLTAIEAAKEAAKAATKAPIAGNPDLEATISATTGAVSEAAKKLAAAKAMRPDVDLALGAKVRGAEATLPRQVPPVIKADGSLPGGLLNLKETGFAKGPYDAKVARLRAQDPKEWRSHPEAMAAQAARFPIREGEDAQAAGLAMDSGDFSKFEELLQLKRNVAIANTIHRVAKEVDRIRGNNPVGLTATIAGTGAAASSGVIPGILAATGVKTLQDYGPNFGANLLYSMEGLPANLAAGVVARGGEYGAKAAIGPAVGVAAKYMKPKISNFADWLKSKAGDQRDEEEAKAKFKSDAGI